MKPVIDEEIVWYGYYKDEAGLFFHNASGVESIVSPLTMPKNGSDW